MCYWLKIACFNDFMTASAYYNGCNHKAVKNGFFLCVDGIHNGVVILAILHIDNIYGFSV